jgi:large subunit ribosomal protein L4
MATVKVYDQNKQESGVVDLAADVFEVEVRPEILHLVVRAQAAAKRAGTHQTKTRAMVSGGGVKPWKQKGTGRARSGSNRSPVWRGGAIIFGPSPRDYSFKVNSKVRTLALKMALSSRLAADALMVVKSIELPEAKTKYFAKIAGTLGLRKALIVTQVDAGDLVRSARNIPGLTLTTPDRLSVAEILKHKQLVLLESAVESVHARFAGKGNCNGAG